MIVQKLHIKSLLSIGFLWILVLNCSSLNGANDAQKQINELIYLNKKVEYDSTEQINSIALRMLEEYKIGETNDSVLGYHYMLVGASYLKQDQSIQKGTEYLIKADSLFESCDFKQGLLENYFRLNKVNCTNRYWDVANLYKNKAKQLLSTPFDSARYFNMLFNQYIFKGDFDSAFLIKEITLNTFNGFKDTSLTMRYERAKLYKNLAYIYLIPQKAAKTYRTNYSTAVKYSKKALEVGNFTKTSHIRWYMHHLTNLAYCYRWMTKYDSALKYNYELEVCLKALPNSKNYREYMGLYSQRSAIYNRLGRYKEAVQLSYLDGYYTDSFYKQQLENNSTNLIKDHEKALAEQKLLQLEAQNKLNNKYLWLLGIACFLILCLAIYAFLNQFKLRKLNKKTTKLSENLALSLTEIHHRIKNNLQVISSVLSIQKSKLKNPEVKAALSNSQNRIKSMSLLHEQLYKENKFDKIDLAVYLNQIIEHLSKTYNDSSIEIKQDIVSLDMEIDRSISVGMITHELLTNCFRHAFKEEHPNPQITIKGILENEAFILSIVDNGKGMTDSKKEKNAGSQIIEALTLKLKAQLQMETKVGTSVQLKFPKA